MASPMEPLRILLADDDEEDQELLKEALVKQMPSVEVLTVDDGQQAMNYLQRCADPLLPQLIVLDYKMPVLDGAETARQVTGDTRYSSIPVVVWSTSTQPKYRESSLNSGAKHYFVKPDNEGQLASLAQTLLSLIQAGPEGQ